MQRSFDINAISAVANHPSVVELMAGVYSIEETIEEFVDDQRNVVFLDSTGYVAFHYAAPRTYLAHYAFIAGHRGAQALAKCKQVAEAMFDKFNAYSLWACAPVKLRGSTLFIRWLGAKRVGVHEDHEYYVLTKD